MPAQLDSPIDLRGDLVTILPPYGVAFITTPGLVMKSGLAGRCEGLG